MFDPHNCILFALLRVWQRGGYVVIRRSRYGWWPHFLWSPDLVSFEEYLPRVPNHHLPLPPPLYRGYVRHTTAAEQTNARMPSPATR